MNPPMTEQSPQAVDAPAAADVARNSRTFGVIWLVQLIARVGNGLTAFGLAVHVYQLSGLTTSVALVTMAAFLPALLLAPLGGVLVDRFDRRLLMILSDTFAALGLATLALMLHAGVTSVPLICAAVGTVSVFTAVLDPAYRATVTDLLTADQYARAGGLVQLASASQYLISPALAGVLMALVGITGILIIDIATTALTTVCMVAVWRTIRTPRRPVEQSFWADFASGLRFLAQHRGITMLMLLVTLVTFCMGFLQTLLTPMLLELADEQVLGFVRSIAAVGMLVSSLLIGFVGLGHRYRGALGVALGLAAVTVFWLGTTTNVVLIGALAFAFFLTLPPLNTSVEVLARASIPNDTQGKVWGLMGLISQLGYVAAYALSGPLADQVFDPLLVPGGPLADSLGRLIGVGPTRGIGLMFMIVGVLLAVLAVCIPRARAVDALQRAAVTSIEREGC